MALVKTIRLKSKTKTPGYGKEVCGGEKGLIKMGGEEQGESECIVYMNGNVKGQI